MKEGAKLQSVIKLVTLEKKYINEMARLANNIKIASQVRAGFPHPYTRVDAEQFIASSKVQKGTAVYAIIWHDRFVGLTSLAFNVSKTEAEVGYWIGEEYWNRGIVSGALRIALKKAFALKNLELVKAEVLENNIASMRVLEKAGFVRDKLLDKSCNNFNPNEKSYLYLLKRSTEA